MVEIRFLKDYQNIKKGEIVESSKKSAENYVSQGYAEYAEKEDNKNNDAKYYRDKHVIESHGKDRLDNDDKYTFVEAFKVDPENYDKITNTSDKDKKEDIRKIFTRLGQAEQFSSVQPFFYDKSGMWWIWNNKELFWELSDETDLLNLINDNLDIDVTTTKNKTELITALKLIGRRNIPKEQPKDTIQFKDGIYKVTEEDDNLYSDFIPNPSYFITNPIPWRVGSTDETPNMDRIFKDWVGEKNVQTLYEILAYCLIPDYPIHRIFCFIGAGMNGKSKYLELLSKFIGSKNVTSTELDVLLNSRFEVTRLHKKLVCQMGETNFSEMNKTSMLKKLSGGDLIPFEYKNKTPFEDKNYAKILISTNNLPSTNDKTIGFYRRWLIIDFPNQFTEKKDILAEIPEEEYENLARKCIKILQKLLVTREFSEEGDIKERMSRYEDRSDPLEKFIKEYTEEDHEGHIWKWEFEKKLNQWCNEMRFRSISDVVIGRKMKSKGIHQALRNVDFLKYGSNKRLRCWEGIKWKNPEENNTS